MLTEIEAARNAPEVSGSGPACRADPDAGTRLALQKPRFRGAVLLIHRDNVNYAAFWGTPLTVRSASARTFLMTEYLILRLNRRVLVSDAERRDFITDQQARRYAATLLEGCDVVEVWCGNRLVAEVRPEPL